MVAAIVRLLGSCTLPDISGHVAGAVGVQQYSTAMS